MARARNQLRETGPKPTVFGGSHWTFGQYELERDRAGFGMDTIVPPCMETHGQDRMLAPFTRNRCIRHERASYFGVAVRVDLARIETTSWPFDQDDTVLERMSVPTSGQTHPTSICSIGMPGRTEAQPTCPWSEPIVEDRLVIRGLANPLAGFYVVAAWPNLVRMAPDI